MPNSARTVSGARVVLLPPKYIELWNRQVQQRIDNYWETFKPEIFANKNMFAELDRMAHAEAMSYVTSTLRRDMGSESDQFIKQSSSGGQFEFRTVPLGSYQLLVHVNVDGRDVLWSHTIEVTNDVP